MNAIVIYATITGNNEDVADILTEAFEDQDIAVKEVEISQVDSDTLTDYNIIVVVPYTYDEGALPEEGLDFYDDLQDVDLTGHVFAVAGSGDVFYGDDYGVAVDKFDTRLAATNAQRGADKLKINLAPDETDIDRLDDMAAALIKAAK
ncbi:flavodoxin domain-containing protein [Furfurilactobacillus sp. WILCCON 0119]|uniref:flavodoxin domain-containing protein n=1 Tax=Furfurilactobacillus entadae TaxID=2922307 RepID=UPI0035E5C200